MHSRTIAFLVALSGPLAVAQIPVDHGIRFSYTNIGTESIDIAAGTATELAGGPGFSDAINCGVIDPVTGHLWAGGVQFSAGRLWKGTLSGLSIASWDIFSDLPGNLSSRGIDLDWNGDLFVCEDNTIYQVDRDTGVSTTWDTNTYSLGIFNTLCIVQETNTMYVGCWNDGSLGGSAGILEYDLSAGPGPGTLVADFPALGLDGQISGMDDGFGVIYVTTFEASVGQSVVLFDPTSGTAFAAPGAPVGNPLYGVYIDRKTALAHLVELGTTADPYYTLDITTGTLTTVVSTAVAGQIPSDVGVNDFTDRTEVFPQRPSASGDFTLEAAAHGFPGDIAGVAVVAINGAPVNPIVLGASVCDSGGFASFAAPVLGSTVTPGDQYSILSARIDTGGQLHLGTQVEVIVQP